LKNENQDTSLVYDFSLALGAEYKMSLHPDFNWDDSNTLALAIDSIGTEDSGAKNLAIQKVKQVDAGADFNLNGNILKGIGWENYFFPVYCCADPPLGGSLFCFENADKTLQVGDCNLLKDTNAVIKDNSIKIYPNPTNGFINIENGFGKTVSVFNVVGQQIKEQVLFDSGINLSDLLSGVYMLLFDNGEIFRVIIL